MFREPDSPHKVIKELAGQEASKRRNIDLYTVTAIDAEDTTTGLISDYKCSIKHTMTKIQYFDVPIIGLGLGNFKGILKYPNVGDMVLIAFFDDTPDPFVLGTVFDFFTQLPDNVPQIKRDEILMVNQEFGSAFYMTNDNRMLLKVADPVDGNFDDALSLKRAQITLNPGTGVTPGSITSSTDGAMTDVVGLALTQGVGGAWTVTVGGAATILTTGIISISQVGTGAGIFIDASGNVTIKGKTIDFVKV